MTDFFALLDQPRRPWLELGHLDEVYRASARSTHPDQAPTRDLSFAELNQAYRTLHDDKLRLQHLLSLEGKSITSDAREIPADLVELFMQIAPVLKSGELDDLERIGVVLNEGLAEASRRLRALNEEWPSAAALAEAEQLYGRFSFLQRWQNLLEEQRFKKVNSSA